MIDLTLRPMTSADLAAVHRLEVAISPDPWSLDLLAGELPSGPDDPAADRVWLVAEADESLVGFAGVLLIADEAHIMNLAVDRSWRRQGVASRLLAGVLLAATDRGAIDATLEVRASNEPAQALYRRFDFTESGRRPRYYGNGEDAVIMWIRKLYRPVHQQRWLALLGDRSVDV